MEFLGTGEKTGRTGAQAREARMESAEVISTGVMVGLAQTLEMEGTASVAEMGNLVEMAEIFHLIFLTGLRRAIRSFLAAATVGTEARAGVEVKVEMVEQAEMAATGPIVRVVREGLAAAVEGVMAVRVAQEAQEVLGALGVMVETVGIST